MVSCFLQVREISRAGKVFVELGHGFEPRRLVVSTRRATGESRKVHSGGEGESPTGGEEGRGPWLKRVRGVKGRDAPGS